MPIKLTFLEKARDTHKFHFSKRKENDGKWGVKQTAKALNMSVGAVSEDLLIGKWLKSHEKQLERFDYRYEAK